MNKKSILFQVLFLAISLAVFAGDTNYTHFVIRASATDTTIRNLGGSHLVVYDQNAKQGKLLLFMTGTNGIANRGPVAFYKTVVEQGYRLIALAYNDTPAVAQICRDAMLDKDSNCADEFRAKRMYGRSASFPYISDYPQDAIVYRLVKLLQYLMKNDPNANWGQYLDDKGNPKWTEIAVCGQSQGGGMAEYLGKHEMVYRVISFSGGWDYSGKDRIANWYSTSNITPPDVWYGTYNVAEDAAKTLAQTYEALKIPKAHVHALDLPARQGRPPHVEGVGNPTYKNIWIEMLGKGN